MRKDSSGRRERGVSTVLGFVLIFGLVVTTFAIYQSDVVPHQNRNAEFEYSENADDQLSELRAAVDTTGAEGTRSSAMLDASPEYPQRALAVNAPEPEGRIETTETYDVSVSGLHADETPYWNGTTRRFDTRVVRISPRFNYLDHESTYYLENGVAVRTENEEDYTRRIGGSTVSGEYIDIVIVDGEVRRTDGSFDLEVYPVSSTTEYQRLEADADATVRVPTVRDQSAWDAAVDGNDNVSDVTVYCHGTTNLKATNCPDEEVGHAELELVEDENYSVRVTEVSLESPDDPDATYVTMRPSGGITSDESQSFVVTARDQYGNPVADASVSLGRSGPGTLTAASVTTNREGRATFAVENAEIGVTQIRASIDDGSPDYETASHVVGGPGATGVPSFAIYSSGQYRPGLGDIETLRLSEAHTVPDSSTDCLLVGDSGGVLGGLLGSLNCDADSFRTVQGSVTITADGEQYTLQYYLFDEDGDGDVTDGDDGGGVVIESNESDDTVFEGTLTDAAAENMTTENGTDVLDSSNYESGSVAWDNDYGCYDQCGPFDGPDQEGYEASSPYDDGDGDGGYSSFDDVELTDSDVFIEEAHGRVTVTVDDE